MPESSQDLQLPPLDVALGLAQGLPLVDVVGGFLRCLHSLLDLERTLAPGPLQEAVRDHIEAIRARGRRMEELPGGAAALPPGYGGLLEDSDLRAYAQPDLDAILDGTARLLGPALRASKAGDRAAATLLTEVAGLLYDDLGQVPFARGWYSLDPVVPGQSRFDPGRHRAISSETLEGARGLVIAVQRVGRRRADTGALVTPAEVVVGA